MVVSSPISSNTYIKSLIDGHSTAQLKTLLQGILNLLLSNTDGNLKSAYAPPPTIVCYFCGDAGHTKNECKERKLFISKEDRIRYNKLFPGAHRGQQSKKSKDNKFTSRNHQDIKVIQDSSPKTATNVENKCTDRKRYDFKVVNEYLSEIHTQEPKTPCAEQNKTQKEFSEAPLDAAYHVQEFNVDVFNPQEFKKSLFCQIHNTQQQVRVKLPSRRTAPVIPSSSKTSSSGSPCTMLSQIKTEDRVIAKPRTPKCTVKSRPDHKLLVPQLEPSTTLDEDLTITQDTQAHPNVIASSASDSDSSDRSSTFISRHTDSGSSSLKASSPTRPNFFSKPPEFGTSLFTVASKGIRYLPVIDLYCSETNKNLGGSDVNIQNTYEQYVNTSHVIYDQD